MLLRAPATFLRSPRNPHPQNPESRILYPSLLTLNAKHEPLCWTRQVSILTGLPEGQLGEKAKAGKEAWCHKALGAEVQVECCKSSEKHAWSAKRRILVDDRLSLKVVPTPSTRDPKPEAATRSPKT